MVPEPIDHDGETNIEQELANADCIDTARTAFTVADDAPNNYRAADIEPDIAQLARPNDVYGNSHTAVLYDPDSDSRFCAIAGRADDDTVWTIYDTGVFTVVEIDAEYPVHDIEEWPDEEPDTCSRTVFHEITGIAEGWRVESISDGSAQFWDEQDHGNLIIEFVLNGGAA
ncbi:hypothetical protein [Natrinema sp. 1APR25-10V2]|uniref:hypothetical protein n=1 Tax=Natrinema sp. 1APR25-10V2 TaxID=2951081 RepID=UPI0028753C38|nr:hypothetical protein [Natrinema sp. 1APR25-10V2]MDS0474032.1 hypothetical protein [Natrinema sp. 1APR25-10V2]